MLRSLSHLCRLMFSTLSRFIPVFPSMPLDRIGRVAGRFSLILNDHADSAIRGCFGLLRPPQSPVGIPAYLRHLVCADAIGLHQPPGNI